jgi:hypothetical protein
MLLRGRFNGVKALQVLLTLSLSARPLSALRPGRSHSHQNLKLYRRWARRASARGAGPNRAWG